MTMPSTGPANHQRQAERRPGETTTLLTVRSASHTLREALMRVRVLTFRYVGALSVIAGLLIAGQAIVQQALDRQEGDARLVNVAGRQRMLSQRLCMLLLAISVEHPAHPPDAPGVPQGV